MRQLNKLLYRDKSYLTELRRLPRGSVKQLRQFVDLSASTLKERRRSEEAFKTEVSRHVLDRLKALLASDQTEIEAEDIHVALLRYERFQLRRGKDSEALAARRSSEEELDEVARVGIQLERDEIQRMFENGNLSRNGIKEMKNNLLVMEHAH